MSGGPKTHENLLVLLLNILKAIWKKSITMDNPLCPHSQAETAGVHKYIYTSRYGHITYPYNPCKLKVYKLIPKGLLLQFILRFND